MVIQEVNDLNNFPLEGLIGSLMTYEMTCKTHDEFDEYENNLPKNMKDLTLQTIKYHLSDNL